MRRLTYTHPKDGEVRIPLADMRRAVEKALADLSKRDRKIVSSRISNESFKAICQEMTITNDQALLTWQTFKAKFFQILRQDYSEKRVNTWAGLWD